MNYIDDILEIRKQRKVSVVKLSKITGIPKERLYKWESGVGNPKAEDTKKLQNWLNNIEEVQENKAEPGLLPLISQLMHKQNSLMELQNQLLDEMKSEVKDKIKRIDSNLSTTLGGVLQISLHVESAREVMLKSLARLEKKPHDALKNEADKIVVQLMKEHGKQGSVVDGGK